MRHNSSNSVIYDPEYRRIHRKEKREYDIKHRLKTCYGMTIEDYDKMFIAQGGRCAACGKEFEKNLCVDHDHKTGKVRGLLCSNCNLVLGLVEDEPERLAKLQKYLLS